MEPSDKAQALLDFLDLSAEKLFGRSYTQSIKNNVCVSCGKEAVEFKDELSRKEYTISGFCQSCQDDVFETEE